MSTQQYPEHILKQADDMAHKTAIEASYIMAAEGSINSDQLEKIILDTLNLPALLMAMEHAFNLAKSHEEMMAANASLLNQLSQHQQAVKQLVGALEHYPLEKWWLLKSQALSTAKQLLEKRA